MNFLQEQTKFYTDASAKLKKITFEMHMISDPKFRKRIETQREIMRLRSDFMHQLNLTYKHVLIHKGNVPINSDKFLDGQRATKIPIGVYRVQVFSTLKN